jgi:hypothetical protein
VVPPRQQHRADETCPQQHGGGTSAGKVQGGQKREERRQLEKAALAALGLDDSDEEAEPCRASGAGSTQKAPEAAQQLLAPAHDLEERAAGAPSAGTGLAAREQARGAKAAAPSVAAAGSKVGKGCKHPHPSSRPAAGLSAPDIEAGIKKKQDEEAQARKQKREEKGSSKLAPGAGAPHRPVGDAKDSKPASGEVTAMSRAARKHAGYAEDGLQQPTAAAAAVAAATTTTASTTLAGAADGKTDSARAGQGSKNSAERIAATPTSLTGMKPGLLAVSGQRPQPAKDGKARQKQQARKSGPAAAAGGGPADVYPSDFEIKGDWDVCIHRFVDPLLLLGSAATSLLIDFLDWWEYECCDCMRSIVTARRMFAPFHPSAHVRAHTHTCMSAPFHPSSSTFPSLCAPPVL